MNTPDSLSLLDETLERHGKRQLLLFFQLHLKNDRPYALKLINDERLHFPSLFLLKDLLKNSNCISDLNLRNRIALDLIFEILTGEKDIWPFDSFSCKQISRVNEVLQWILGTGILKDGLAKDYDEVIDKVCLLLSKVYRDKSVIQSMVDLIFKRYRRGAFYGDLCWSFFEYGDVHSLMLIASRLLSQDKRDVELAQRLLRFVPGMELNTLSCEHKYYVCFLPWFKENNMFLRYTGESFHHTKYPLHYSLNPEAKYLCRVVANNTGCILGDISEEEMQLLREFNNLEENIKNLLCSFSYALNTESSSLWKHWLQFPMEEQISIARIGGVR